MRTKSNYCGPQALAAGLAPPSDGKIYRCLGKLIEKLPRSGILLVSAYDSV